MVVRVEGSRNFLSREDLQLVLECVACCMLADELLYSYKYKPLFTQKG